MDKVLEQEEVLERLCGLFPYVMRLMKIMGVDENGDGGIHRCFQRAAHTQQSGEDDAMVEDDRS